jgi:hypothetical protein
MNDFENREAWPKAKPQRLPRPSYFPFFFALSLLFLFWGMVSLWVMAVTGFVGLCVSLAGWIGDLLAEDAIAANETPAA